MQSLACELERVIQKKKKKGGRRWSRITARVRAVMVGIWKTREGASMPAVEFSGTDSYEWLQGGFFLLHRVDVLMGDRRVIGVETIWFDPARRCYRTHFVDVEGQTSTYEAQLDGREWTLASLADRFAGHFSEDWATISGRWERTVGDADWEPWMDVTLTRD